MNSLPLRPGLQVRRSTNSARMKCCYVKDYSLEGTFDRESAFQFRKPLMKRSVAKMMVKGSKIPSHFLPRHCSKRRTRNLWAERESQS